MVHAALLIHPAQRDAMTITYFKRFRMEIDLDSVEIFAPRLPECYSWQPWDPALVNEHAETKYQSFQTEIDANVFPCLAARDGCRRLMKEISARNGFIAEATWLLVFQTQGGKAEFCGTVQGVRDDGYGSIQNLGVTPRHRGFGLGTALLQQALLGFQQVGLSRAFLEVTARNAGAIRLYERFGFTRVRTVYKSAEMAAV